MLSKTAICNVALGRIGSRQLLSDFDTDARAEGVACRTYYSMCEAIVLRAMHWPFATKEVALALLDTNTTSPLYEYQYPTDCLFIQNIFTADTKGTVGSRPSVSIPYEVTGVTEGNAKRILSDYEDLICRYTMSNVSPTSISAGLYDANFIDALAYLLASNICLMLGQKEIHPAMYRQYEMSLNNARALANDEEQTDVSNWLDNNDLINARA